MSPPAGAGSPDPLWSDLGDRLLRGVAHTLNNRAHAVLSIGAALDETTSPLVLMLREESTRLESAVRLLRLLARGEAPHAESMRAEDLLTDAAALHPQRADASGAAVDLGIDDDVPPVRVDPVAALHALLLLFDAAEPAGGAVTVTADRDGATLRIRVAGVVGPTGDAARDIPDEVLDAVVRLLAPDGGSVTRDGLAVAMRLPALAGGR